MKSSETTIIQSRTMRNRILAFFILGLWGLSVAMIAYSSRTGTLLALAGSLVVGFASYRFPSRKIPIFCVIVVLSSWVNNVADIHGVPFSMPLFFSFAAAQFFNPDFGGDPNFSESFLRPVEFLFGS